MDYSKILILSDVDSTLARDGKLSDENAKAIRFFTERGGLFSVATGRTPEYIRENYMPKLKVTAPLAAINGTVIASPDNFEMIWKDPLEKSFLPVINFIRENCADLEKILAYRYDKTVFCGDDFDDNDGQEYFKLLAVTYSESEALQLQNLLRSRFGEKLDFYRSWSTGVEIINKTAGKGICLKKIKELTGAEIAIGIGDYENDITLLRDADIAVAVGSGIKELKKCADYITVPFENHAVADLIYNLDKILKN